MELVTAAPVGVAAAVHAAFIVDPCLHRPTDRAVEMDGGGSDSDTADTTDTDTRVSPPVLLSGMVMTRAVRALCDI